MFLYEDPELRQGPYGAPPFLPLTQLSFLKRVLPWGCYPHIHQEEYEITCTLGCGRIFLPGCSVQLPPHSLTIVPPCVAHFYGDEPQPAAPLSYYAMRFRASGTEAELGRLLAEYGTATVCDRERSARIESLLSAILAEPGEGKIDACAQSASLAALLLCEKALHGSGRSIAISAPEYANDILIYLQKHTHTSVNMEMLEKEFNLSQSHIFRVFSKTYHTSPMKYLTYCRMREARTLIMSQQMDTASLAELLRYDNRYHFIHTFEKFYGCRPEEYRSEYD